MKSRTQDLGKINGKKVDYKTAVETLVGKASLGDELKGQMKSVVVNDAYYNKVSADNRLFGRHNVNSYISMSMRNVLIQNGACDLPANNLPDAQGGCLVIEKDSKGNPEGFVVGTIKDAKGLIHIYRAEIKNKSTVEVIKQIAKIENNATIIYSPRSEARPMEVVLPTVTPSPLPNDPPASDEKMEARARVKQAILSGQTIDSVDLWRAVLVETEVERTQAEKDASGIRRQMEKVQQTDLPSGYATCFLGGKATLPWVFVIRLDGILDRVSAQSKVHVYCYQDNILRVKFGVLLTLKENAIGFRLPGTKSILGGAGFAMLNGVTDIAVTKQADGSLLPYRKQACIMSADAGWIFGAGASALCLSDGKLQNPIVGGGIRLSLTAGATVSPLSIYQIGLDPDDF
jgi:hypothetical protein